MLFVDHEYFKEVMRNIIINSIEACKDIKDTQIRITIDRKYKFCVISVIDNGIGINRENSKHLFKPFYSTKSTISNWGLGLAFCQHIIEAFGGIITADSKPGKFTRFDIYIPEVKDG